jgi:diguanylate cyclase (GGDEF)-like protein/PAS domain S-box-containing protein
MSVIHPDDVPQVEALWETALRTGQPFDSRYRFRCRDGSYRWFRDRGRPRRGSDGDIVKWYGSVEEIHEQVVAEEALRRSEERYRLASRATSDVIWDWCPSAEKVEWGGAIGSHFGYHGAEEGTSFAWWSERVHPDDRDKVLESLRRAIAGTESHWADEYRFRKADDTFAYILSRGTIVRNARGEAVRAVGAMIDISELKRVEASLRRAALHDPLTDLPNRTLFEQRLGEALSAAERRGSQVGLIILDVDQFKVFNDTRGHHAGDELLCWIARAVQEGQRADATVARLGGDEFGIIIPGFTDDAADPVLERLRQPFYFGHEICNVAVSAGLAIWPSDAERLEDLIKCADLALYACKADRQNGIRRFHPAMREAANERMRMLETASAALRDERLFPYYQPKVCLKTGTLIGLEALLRWQHPSQGIQSPSTIAAAFDNAELAPRITDRVVECVLADIKLWRDHGLDFGRVAINAAAADFMRSDFDKRLLGKLEEEGVSPRFLELEVTENVLVGREAKKFGAILRELKRAGMTIALDDFGTGYASLSHLNAFPVDTLKIDQSFVRQLCTGQRGDEAIVRAVIGLARNMRAVTVAEGVETREQAVRLQELKCDAAQGYFFSRPVHAQQVSLTLTKGMLHWTAIAGSRPTGKKIISSP